MDWVATETRAKVRTAAAMKSFTSASSSGLRAGLRVKYYIAFVAERLKKKYAAQINKIVLDMA